MPTRSWSSPPRHLLVLFVGITGVLASALGWLGWRLLRQDRALADQQVRTRLEATADEAMAEARRRIGGVEALLSAAATGSPTEAAARLATAADGLPAGAVFVLVETGTVRAFPANRLRYYPVVPAGPDLPAATFRRGETLEFRARDFAAAARAYGNQAASGDARVRAGALLRLGRVQRKLERHEDALDTYADLARLDDLPVGEFPAGLIGSFGRIETLRALGREDDAREEGRALRAALSAGRWRLTPAVYDFYAGELERVIPEDSARAAADRRDLAVADGVRALWELRDALPAVPPPLVAQRRPALLLRHRGSARTVGFIASRAFVEAAWLGELHAAAARQGMALHVMEAADSGATDDVIRVGARTGLPWNLHVAMRDPSVVLAGLRERQRLMAAGLLLTIMLVAFGGYAVTRAVRREMAVARLQSEFVSAVSHEFRTPLTSMRQLTEMLSSGRVPSEERREEYYAVINRETERLHRLVEGLLDFGRMEAGALEFRMERIAVDEFVRDVVDEFRLERGAAGSGITTNGTGNGVAVRADREALGRMLWNLLDNALKYSPERVDVHVGVTVTGAQVAVSVRDRGIGMAAEDVEAVFQKFVRGSASRSLNVTGTGIGLAMVRHIVDAHGGDIRVHSRPGEGSTFTVLLPIASAS